MNKKVITVVVGVGIFTAGVFFGKQSQKKTHRKKTVYGGVINIFYDNNNNPEPYLALTIPPQDLATLADVIFEVVKN